ncbi:toll/interleukin-1 receptor domain-containing protein [Desulfonatronum sp. SC1]|uniref:toll/interleukin-1 receptor domain-containing protein n=1 Tax=Desulfonatronum sp. SC1 TaxID=2109626 RepID=UPI000D30C5FD|nr:toll/interleukin-1 receptor domain-containing protein [Desulfonatronum sp. SC1]PTN32380.1 TIR domain-containing protein [Desulfonatronum sp. SC1]
MKPSDRINLIKEISAFLGKENWTLIDLTLKQFKFPWSDQWNGNSTEDYIIDMISNAEDQSLVDLAKHLGVVTELESSEQPAFWSPNQPRIFLSHLATEKRSLKIFKAELGKYGLACFVAHEDIEPTKEWQSEIEIALTTMDALVAYLTPGFNESKWTDQEIGVAIGRKVPIVPLKVGIDPYGFIGKYQALQAKDRMPNEVAREIVELLAAKPQIAFKISNALVERLEDSSSWAESKRVMDLIEKCRQFSDEVLERLKAAPKDNSQVRDAWGVPERIKTIVEKISS